jgi:hypothetical protein
MNKKKVDKLGYEEYERRPTGLHDFAIHIMNRAFSLLTLFRIRYFDYRSL